MEFQSIRSLYNNERSEMVISSFTCTDSGRCREARGMY